MTQTFHIDPPEFTASDASLWTPRNRGTLDPHSADLRDVLGIALDRPVVMTGHQAGFWHCGILAKTLAAAGLASRDVASITRPQLVHIVVDQDDNDAGLIEYPSRDASGVITVRQWRLAPQVEGVPTGLRPAVPDPTAPVDGARDFVNQGLADIAKAVRARADQPSIAMQLAHAAHDLVAARCPGARTWHIISGLALSQSHAFAAFAEKMAADPRACVQAYNQAASEHPAAGVRPLQLHDDDARIELPIWRVSPLGGRVSVRVSDVRAALAHSELTSLAPKALFMTALLRTFACDLFVHGTGGGVYDKVMERWLELWSSRSSSIALGANSQFIAQNLAPAVVATATVRLPLLNAPVPTAAEVARARWLAHAARHNPALLNDANAAAAKHLALATMRGADAAARLAAYRAAHAELAAYRTRHADELDRLTDAAARLEHLRAAAGPALRRTWAFPLAPAQSLVDLAARAQAHLK
jgi:hypothetical protein